MSISTGNKLSNGDLSGVSVSDGTRNGGDLLINDELLDLDPTEFELPPVDHLPTLEEILGESGEVGLLSSDELLGVSGGEDGGGSSSGGRGEVEFDDTSDISSVVGSTVSSATPKSNDWKKPKKQRKKSEILRFAKVRGISSQIASAASSDRVRAGNPSAIAVYNAQSGGGKGAENVVAVGTSHGLVLVFDSAQQALKYCVGRSRTEEYGKVSALVFSQNGMKLLIGYSKGHIQLVESPTGKISLTLPPDQAHQAGKGVIHLEFTNNASVAVCSDSGGSVFELRFSFGLTGSTARVRCVFSGSRGEVCAIAPLHVPPKLRSTCRHYSEPLLLGLISMTKVMVVTLKPPTKVAFATPLVGPAEAPPLLAWQWVPIQISAKIRIVDPVVTFCRGPVMFFYQIHTSDGQNFRSFCLQKVDLSFMPVAFQWINTRCLVVLDEKEKIHLQEAGTSDGTLETVEANKVKIVYSSSDFKGLATGGNVSEAFRALGDRACYHSLVSDGNGRVFVLGLNGIFTVSLRTWLERVEALVDVNDLPGAIQLALDFYTGRLKVGTGGGKSEGRIGGQKSESGKWKEIIADKTVDLMLYYVDNSMNKDAPRSGKIQVLQEHYKSVVPVCLEACSSLERWDLLYGDIYDRFSRDQIARGFFLECLEELLLDGALPDVPPALVQDYLSHLENEGMLATLESSIVRIPITSLDLHQVMTLCRVHGLYDGIIFVLNRALKDYLTPLEEMITGLEKALRSSELLSDQQILLGNKILLYLSCCLCGRAYPVGALPPQEARLVSKEVYDFLISHHSSKSEESREFPFLRLLLKFDTREFLNVLSMSIQMGAFFTFIARLVVQQDGRVSVSKDHFHQLLEAVLSSGEVGVGTSSFEERQQAVLELLHAPPTQNIIDKKVVLTWAEKGKYLQICEFLYWDERNFEKVLECYLQDHYRQEQVFQLLKQFLSGTDLLNSEKLSVKRKVQQCLPTIALVDSRQCAELLIDLMQNSLAVLTDKLSDDQQLLHRVLVDIFDYRQSTGHSTVCDDETVGRKLAESFLVSICKQTSSDLVGGRVMKFLGDWEIYVEKNESILRICREYKVVGPLVHLLERRWEWEEAFQVLNKSLVDSLSLLPTSEESSAHLVRSGRESVGFCQRMCSGAHLTENRRQEFWFSVFDTLLQLPAALLNQNPELGELLSETVHTMIMFVKPADVLERLFEHPAFKGGIYSEYADMINTIIQSYDYEKVLLDKVVGAISGDAYQSLRSNWLGLRAAIHGNFLSCLFCGQLGDLESSVLFSCQHFYHVGCLQDNNSFTKKLDGTQEWLCGICSQRSGNSKLAGSSGSTKREMVVPARRRSTLTDSRKLKFLESSHNRSKWDNPFEDGVQNEFGDTVFDEQGFTLRLAPPRI